MLLLLDLPVEVQEHILSFLDGVSFSKVCRVCKLWRDLHSALQNRLPLWKQFCLWEIAEDVLLQITYSTSLKQLIDLYTEVSKHQENTWQIWKTLYCTWYRTRFIGKWVPLETIIQITGHEDQERYITCAKILGDKIVVGCQDGYMTFVDGLTGEEDQQFPIKIDHNVDVSDIIFIRLECGVEFINCLAFYDHIVSSSVWGSVKLTSLRDGYSAVSKVLGYVGSLDSWGTLVTNENNRYGQSQCELMRAVKNDQGNYSLSHIKTLYYYDSGFSMSQIWQELLLVGGFDSVAVIDHNIPKGIWGVDNLRSVMDHIEDKSVEDIVFKAGVGLCITDNGFFHASIDNGHTWASSNAMLVAGSKPTKLALWGTLLAIAFLSGQVNIYYLPNKSDFIFGFLGNPQAVINTESRICGRMDIGDDGECPMITIVTETGIKVVRWFHPL